MTTYLIPSSWPCSTKSLDSLDSLAAPGSEQGCHVCAGVVSMEHGAWSMGVGGYSMRLAASDPSFLLLGPPPQVAATRTRPESASPSSTSCPAAVTLVTPAISSCAYVGSSTMPIPSSHTYPLPLLPLTTHSLTCHCHLSLSLSFTRSLFRSLSTPVGTATPGPLQLACSP